MADRFDASLIAFHSVSRKLGEQWHVPYFRRALAEANRHPDGRWALAALCGARALNNVVGPHGEGRENRGLLSWNPIYVPKPLLDLPRVERPPEEHSAWVKAFARRLGAAAVGIAQLDRDRVYGRVQINPYAAEEPITKPIEFAPIEAPEETEQALRIPEAVNRAVVLLVPLDPRELRSRSFAASSVETNLGYSQMGVQALSLAEAIRGAGYTAIPCMNDTALSVPLAVDAGLGIAGRHGLLIATGIGPGLRIAKVLTDLPLAPDRPCDTAPPKPCFECGACAKVCPAKAIPAGDPTTAAPYPCNRPGTLKWPVDGEACLQHWIDQGSSCALCQGVCPMS